ncbi:MAG TPA: hypothetical protein VK945_12535 [Planococcus sp. (in: firmicutes)]|nr:hypothetical protein [Planococcus sp. (in: firmicutes)]
MEDRFEMSFRNKQVRVWLALMVPALVLTMYFAFFAENPGILAPTPPLVAWIVYYIWRFNYRKKKKSAV